ncbi:MAG: protein-L-isoaspartate(D-aspartate) O-methyltransferase [Armatimonadota bacterium]
MGKLRGVSAFGFWAVALVCLASGCRSVPAPTAAAPAPGFAGQRERMVRLQLRARGVKDDRVLAAMGKVPREEFVPAEERPRAYEDGPLPIGEGQTISQPYIVALMTELLDLKSTDKVLEIGTGSGYQAAVLAELTPHVYTIEIIPELAQRAEATLRRLGYKTVQVRVGNGYLGWPEHAPFNGIIVTCAPEKVPAALREQLAEGGRMVIPVGPQWTNQTLYLLTKRRGRLEQTSVIPVRFVPMVEEAPRPVRPLPSSR